MSYADLWASMGLFAKGIVVVMFVMSAWSWAVSISKWIYLRKSQKETRKFAPEFSRYLQEEQLDGAIALAEKNKKSHVARVLGEALSEVKPLLRDRATITAADINSAERAVERQMLIITAELKRGLGILATTGATAPFVGLLGTTMGIVSAFQGMSASGGSGSLAAITGGVAEATIPRAKNPDSKEESEGEVRLGIDRDGKFYLDVTDPRTGKYTGPRLISDEDLPAQLTTLYANRTVDKVMYLKADEGIEYGRIQAALEIARKAGVRVVGAIAEQERAAKPERQ